MSLNADSVVMQLITGGLPDMPVRLHQPNKKREHLSVDSKYGKIVIKVDNGTVYIKQTMPMLQYHSRQHYRYCQVDLSNPETSIQAICAMIIGMYQGAYNADDERRD